eukprot:m.921627 g.921627  ORF g.921627 m.921627 type:complete len:242 (-) comp23757_c0_seq36:1845-2570(-)
MWSGPTVTVSISPVWRLRICTVHGLSRGTATATSAGATGSTQGAAPASSASNCVPTQGATRYFLVLERTFIRTLNTCASDLATCMSTWQKPRLAAAGCTPIQPPQIHTLPHTRYSSIHNRNKGSTCVHYRMQAHAIFSPVQDDRHQSCIGKGSDGITASEHPQGPTTSQAQHPILNPRATALSTNRRVFRIKGKLPATLHCGNPHDAYLGARRVLAQPMHVVVGMHFHFTPLLHYRTQDQV